MQLFLCALVCLLSTLVGAVSGIGGGVIIKPVLDAILPMDVSVVSLISACAVLVMALFSLIRHTLCRDDGKPRLSSAGPLAFGSLAGGIAGKLVFRSFSGHASVQAVQNGLLFVLLLAILLLTLRPTPGRFRSRGRRWTQYPAGLLLGMLSAFLGVGGGPFNLFVLTRFYGVDYKTSAIYSLMIVAFSQTASLATAALGGGFIVAWEWIACACLAGVLGGVAGRRLQQKMDEKQCRGLYVAILILTLGLCLYNILG